MENILESLLGDYKWILDIITYAIAIASIIVKVTPTLKDDNALLPIIKILGRVGLNKYSPTVR